MTRAVVFDIGGVVCRSHPERRLEALAEASGIPPEEIDARRFCSGLEHALAALGVLNR